MAHSHSSPGLDAVVSTKVLYFTDRSLTPFLINIPKRYKKHEYYGAFMLQDRAISDITSRLLTQSLAQ
ncbi:hypothetical protein XENOCAPTIV_005711 [Xenoophorus captivus]|uniref:Uncharacterized protein n=1 Tax=Xenoophorus captivus TaxID=1517983 RepID=A0ABV0SDH6_9TELE